MDYIENIVYDRNDKKLAIKLSREVDELIIPEMDIDSLSVIEVEPVNYSRDIKKLVIKSNIRYLSNSFMSMFKEVRHLELRGRILSYSDDLLSDYTKLEYVYIETPSPMAKYTFANLKNLKKVEFGIQPKVYTRGMFSSCEKLDVSNLFNEGLMGIDEEVFEGVNIREVNLPSTLCKLNISSFIGCNNLEVIKLNSVVMFEADEIYGFDCKLNSNNGVKVIYYDPRNPVKYLKNFVDSHVKLKPTNNIDNNKLERLYLKARLLGMDLAIDDIPRNLKQFLANYKYIGVKWRNDLIELLKAKLYNASDIKLVGDNKVFIPVRIRGNVGIVHKVYKIGFTKNYIYVLYENEVDRFIACVNISEYTIRKSLYVSDLLSSFNLNTKNVDGNIAGKNTSLISLYMGSSILDFDPEKEDYEVYEQNNNLMLEFNGTKEKINVLG